MIELENTRSEAVATISRYAKSSLRASLLEQAIEGLAPVREQNSRSSAIAAIAQAFLNLDLVSKRNLLLKWLGHLRLLKREAVASELEQMSCVLYELESSIAISGLKAALEGVTEWWA
jgi:hypothetical protein